MTDSRRAPESNLAPGALPSLLLLLLLRLLERQLGGLGRRHGERLDIPPGGIVPADDFQAVVPLLAALERHRSAAGADDLPVLGPLPGWPAVAATGHYRNGILLAPWTAREVARLTLGRSEAELPAFSPKRFLCPA